MSIFVNTTILQTGVLLTTSRITNMQRHCSSVQLRLLLSDVLSFALNINEPISRG